MISEINLKKSKYAKTLLLCFVFCFFVFGLVVVERTPGRRPYTCLGLAFVANGDY